jgi:hypothetical protein
VRAGDVQSGKRWAAEHRRRRLVTGAAETWQRRLPRRGRKAVPRSGKQTRRVREAGEGSAGVRFKGSGGVGSRRASVADSCGGRTWRRGRRDLVQMGADQGRGGGWRWGLSIGPAWASTKQRLVRSIGGSVCRRWRFRTQGAAGHECYRRVRLRFGAGTYRVTIFSHISAKAKFLFVCGMHPFANEGPGSCVDDAVVSHWHHRGGRSPDL